MDLVVQYIFRNKHFSADAYFSFEADPCFVFIILKDQELIEEFGEDITIKTDRRKVFCQKNDYPELLELKTALFHAIQNSPQFQVYSSQYPQREHNLPYRTGLSNHFFANTSYP